MKTIGIKCVKCNDPLIVFDSVADHTVVTVDCVLCSEQTTFLLKDFMEGKKVLTCCGLQLIPNFDLEGDIILALICDRCITQNAVSLDDAINRLYDHPESQLYSEELFH